MLFSSIHQINTSLGISFEKCGLLLVVWDFSSDRSMELIRCCLASLCLRTTAGGERKTGCLRDSMSLEGAPTSITPSLGHLICTVQCSCLSQSLSGMPICTTVLPSFSPLASSQHIPIPAWSKAERCGCLSLPQAPTCPSGVMEGSVASHSALVHVHATALTSAAGTTACAGSSDDLQQLLCLAAVGRSRCNRSYNAWSISSCSHRTGRVQIVLKNSFKKLDPHWQSRMPVLTNKCLRVSRKGFGRRCVQHGHP